MKQRKIFTDVFLHLVYCLQWLHLMNAQFDLFSFSWYLVSSKLIHRSVSQTSVFSLPPPYDVCLLEIECDLDAYTCGEQLLCSAQVSSKSSSSFSLEQNRKTIRSKCFIRMFHTLLEFLNEFVKGFPKLYNYETNYAPHDGQDDFTYTFTNL